MWTSRATRISSDFLNFMSRWAVIAILRLLVVFIFSVYWRLFLRLTLLVSRKWEFRADELACAVAGAQPLVTGLRKVEAAGVAWQSFWISEAAPFLQLGFRPPARLWFRAIPFRPGNLETSGNGKPKTSSINKSPAPWIRTPPSASALRGRFRTVIQLPPRIQPRPSPFSPASK